MEDLFSNKLEEIINENAPLAKRMLPKTLEEFVGQEHILSKGKILRRLIESDKISSVIFYGPPGCGKTALAHIISEKTKSDFVKLNAVNSGASDVKEVLEKAKENLVMYRKRTILMIDEIHRFNKAQQDILLPDVENGTIILIGITTYNPFFSIIPPLISRSYIFKFERLKDEDIEKILKRALKDKQRGLGNFNIEIDDDALSHIIKVSEGDARVALNALEIGVLSTKADENDKIKINLQIAEECVQKKHIVYNEDMHYDIISAFIKSMRGSDPDATLYYLAAMLYAGEDIRFIARRIVICAAEDVGNADPLALVIANSALQIAEFIGMPEAQIPLAQAALYIACAPKSNASYTGISNALKDIEQGKILEIPDYLKDANYKGAERFGYGIDYKYPHNYGGYVDQKYLLEARKYYFPKDSGYEKIIKKRLEEIRRKSLLSKEEQNKEK
jgi:putative ATPase